MLYVQQSLGPDERLVHIGRFHWLFNVFAAMGILWGIALAAVVLAGAVFVQLKTGGSMNIGAPYLAGDSWYTLVTKLHPGVKIVALMMFVMGLLKFAHMMIIRATTEIAVTSNRIIYKRGLVARYVGEISIDRIEGVNVMQTVMGRIFNYGSVIIRGMGVGEVILPPIADPIKFRRAIEYARTI
jgi:uncharacterized membrane protein YdbT with pleckstrin-like domain